MENRRLSCLDGSGGGLESVVCRSLSLSYHDNGSVVAFYTLIISVFQCNIFFPHWLYCMDWATPSSETVPKSKAAMAAPVSQLFKTSFSEQDLCQPMQICRDTPC